MFIRSNLTSDGVVLNSADLCHGGVRYRSVRLSQSHPHVHETVGWTFSSSQLRTGSPEDRRGTNPSNEFTNRSESGKQAGDTLRSRQEKRKTLT